MAFKEGRGSLEKREDEESRASLARQDKLAFLARMDNLETAGYLDPQENQFVVTLGHLECLDHLVFLELEKMDEKVKSGLPLGSKDLQGLLGLPAVLSDVRLLTCRNYRRVHRENLGILEEQVNSVPKVALDILMF